MDDARRADTEAWRGEMPGKLFAYEREDAGALHAHVLSWCSPRPTTCAART